MNILKRSAYLIGTVLAVSCMPEEVPLTPMQRDTTIKMSSVNMKPNYQNQIFYSLVNDEVIKVNDNTAWDLGFSSSGNHVKLNASKVMRAGVSRQSFEETTGVEGVDFKWDVSSGNPDSLAIPKFVVQNFNKVIIIDAGYDLEGNALGFYKMEIVGFNDGEYEFKFGLLENSTARLIKVVQNRRTNYTYFSFEDGIVDIEPDKEDWDIWFGQYQHTFYDPEPFPYLVSGVLHNPYLYKVAQIQAADLSEVRIDSAQNNFEFSAAYDLIGYDWKDFIFESSSYILNTERIFILESNNKPCWKLRFLDFYNNFGEKGNPVFEFQAF